MLRPLLAAALLVAAAMPAPAQFEADSNAPVEITSDAMEWLNTQRIAIARGNADAIQGRYHLHAEVLTAHLNQASGETLDRIRLIEAEGNVRLTTPQETASGKTGVYDVERKVATLEGEVVLTQGDNVLRGERLVMNLETGRSTLVGAPEAAPVTAAGPGGGRVKAIFTPDNQDPGQ
ncbi:MAG TPA: LptA/OstA family protein [Alphaproteobacteria bacterium]